VRAALISIAGQPRDAAGGGPLRVAGKTLARRQLDFALAAGCGRIVVLGDGGSPEAIALRHAAEAAGARFQAIGSGHGLLGAVSAADELLVLAPGLLPDATAAIALLEKGPAVLVLPAAPGVAAGFERIDLERAWAGALVVGGGLVERLAELPPDSEPAPALLRIALQAGVPERRLPEALLADGAWSMVADEASTGPDRAWLRRNLPPARPTAPSGWLARQVLRAFAAGLLARGPATGVLPAAALGLLAIGVAAAAYGFAAIGFGLVAVAAVAGELALGLRRLAEAPFGSQRRHTLAAIVPAGVDIALTACGVAAIAHDWPHRLFPPLVLLGLLLALRPANWSNVSAIAGDRAVLAALLAAAAAFGLAEPAIMLAALALIALQLTQIARPARITAV